MSWVQEEWKDGLNQKVLNKINTLENQNEKLIKEVKQKQFQLESVEAALNKQKKRAEDEKLAVIQVKRENQSLSEQCAKLESKVEKFSHELRSKETFARHLEDQLQRCRAQLDLHTNKTPKHRRNVNNELEQSLSQIKDLEAQLAFEKTQNVNLEKELSQLKSLSQQSENKTFRSSLPWATDDYVSPMKTKHVDLLTGSPLTE